MEQKTIAINSTANDLYMDILTKSLAMTSTTGETLAQRIRTELQTFAEEYILNTDKGLPYFQEVMKKNPNMTVVKSLLVAHLGNVVGVTSIRSLDCYIDKDRCLRVSFAVTGADGQTVKGEV